MALPIPSLPSQGVGPEFRTSSRWGEVFPDAHVGVLVMHDVANPPRSKGLERHKASLREELNTRYARRDRSAVRDEPRLRAYREYYRRFGKSYHVQLQLESILFKGKPLPSGAALVEAMFMAELDDLLLTAGHDLDATRPPFALDVAQGTESYILLRGEPQAPKAGDMMISDQQGIISSIVYGPDRRTQITSGTRNVIFTAYAPPGIAAAAVEDHLQHIWALVLLITPRARLGKLQVHGSG
jgi:DNA/RNA-binding domain of Phe-tRNA-synthetase-like protein